MAIDIEEIKKVPEPAKEMVEMLKVTTETVVQQTEPYINWEKIIDSVDPSHVYIAITIFLIAVLAKPILALAKYIIIFSLIFFLVQYYA